MGTAACHKIDKTLKLREKKQAAEDYVHYELIYKKVGKKPSKIQQCIVLGKHALMTKLFLR